MSRATTLPVDLRSVIPVGWREASTRVMKVHTVLFPGVGVQSGASNDGMDEDKFPCVIPTKVTEPFESGVKDENSSREVVPIDNESTHCWAVVL